MMLPGYVLASNDLASVAFTGESTSTSAAFQRVDGCVVVGEEADHHVLGGRAWRGSPDLHLA